MGDLFKPGDPQALVPGDLAGMRQQQIQLLQQLLGLGPAGAAPTVMQQGLAIAQGKKPTPASPGSGMVGGDPLARLQQFFGALDPFTSDQQRGGTGVSQFLNQPAPEQRALDVAMPGLQEILNGGGPQFEKDLSMANQSGARFGSANAIMRSEALRNLYGQRNQAAQTLGLLSQGAGAGQARQVGWADMPIERKLAILMNLLGVAQQASFNVPTTQSPSPFSQIAGAASAVAPFFMGPAGIAAGAAKNLGSVGK